VTLPSRSSPPERCTVLVILLDEVVAGVDVYGNIGVRGNAGIIKVREIHDAVWCGASKRRVTESHSL
jgi:hypothetical protein